MPARARQEADENEEDAAVVDGVVIGAQTRVAWPRETVVRAADGAADVDVAVVVGVVDQADGVISLQNQFSKIGWGSMCLAP